MIFTILLSTAFSIEFVPQGNINEKGVYGLYNATWVNASAFYQNGYQVLDSRNVTSVNESSMNVNSSVFWFNMNAVNDTLFTRIGNLLGINFSFLNTQYLSAGNFYNTSQVYNKTETDAQQNGQNANFSSIGNWTADKSAYSTKATSDAQYLNATDQRYNESGSVGILNASIINMNASWLTTFNSTYAETTADVTANRSAWFNTYNSTYAGYSTLGNWSADKSSYALSAVVSSIGNWSADKNSYATTARVDAVNSTAIAKSSPGTCASGSVVQNTTTSGVQCISAGGTGTVTQINSGVFTTGGAITGSGTIDVNMTAVGGNLGNWSADKSSYATGARVDSVNSTAVGKATPANCAAGSVVQNTTTSGVSCVAVTSGTVTSVTAGTGLTGGVITATGTVALNTTYTGTLYPSIGADSNVLLNWTKLQNYPTACTAGSYITQLDDAVTCTAAMRTNGESTTGAYSFTGLITTSSSINQTITGTTRYFSNGCYEVANATGLFWVC